MRQKNNRVRWFINSHEMNRYSILREIAVNSHLTQAELGNRVGLSTAMVNAYMKELVYDGVIEYHKKTRRTISYHITPNGHLALRDLNITYLGELAKQYQKTMAAVEALISERNGGQLPQRVMVLGVDVPSNLVVVALENLGTRVLSQNKSLDNSGLSANDWLNAIMTIAEQRRPEAIVIVDATANSDILLCSQKLSEKGIRLIVLGAAQRSLIEAVSA